MLQALRPRCLARPELYSTFIKTPILPIWNEGYRKRLLANMASRNSSQGPEPITLDAFGRDVQRRVAVAGGNAMPRNGGTRRTESKRQLLSAIEATGSRW